MFNAPPEINSIAVITGRDLIGDALIKLPFARALRRAWPNARIHWVTSQDVTAFSTLLRAETRDLIDEIHEMPAWLGTPVRAATQPAPSFDLVLDLRNRWKEALHARKIPHRLFLAMALRHALSDRHPPLFRAKPAHLCDRLLLMVRLAAGYLPPSNGALPVQPDMLQKARTILPEGPVYIGLAPGCSTAQRMWPLERFVDIARIQTAKGRVPVFILGPQELHLHEPLAAALPSALFPLQHPVWQNMKMGLAQTLAVNKCLALIVANDSGPGHMMAAVNGAVVSLFGPTTPEKAAPRADRVAAVCARDYGSTDMTAIPVDAVSRAIDDMLARA
ncbi:MAG: glycosyltransferase family 9 protein [Alphaproteobacteria bacterium]|nr:glycosyltransferase family 9 protein [Alphaproteobacteria bacterium]